MPDNIETLQPITAVVDAPDDDDDPPANEHPDPPPIAPPPEPLREEHLPPLQNARQFAEPNHVARVARGGARITTQQMVDGVVRPKVMDGFMREIMKLARYAIAEKPEWITEFGRDRSIAIAIRRPGEGKRAHGRRMKDDWMAVLRNAMNEPLFNINNITAEDYADYLGQQVHYRTGANLSPGGYSGKRSAMHHLFRCHNGYGFPPIWESELRRFYSGLTRVVASRNTRHARQAIRGQPHPDERRNRHDANQQANEEDDDDDSAASFVDSDDEREDMKSGREPCTPQLYQFICRKALEWGTIEGIFLACFVVWTWNLACRGHNTAKVKFGHMSWSNPSDALGVKFKHTKTDQSGKEKRKKRALYSNVFAPEIDIVFVTALYLATCFQSRQGGGNLLFPGTDPEGQASRAADLLKKLLKEHQDYIEGVLGYDTIDDIGIHSFRKGVATYLASLPGGPSPAAICLRAGWAMGKIKDIYFRWMSTGDEFVGRVSSLLSMFKKDFAVSQVQFDSSVDGVWILNTVKACFPFFHEIRGFKSILRNCLASLCYHREFVASLPPGHLAHNIPIFRRPEMLEPVDMHQTRLLYSWETEGGYTASGVPPHIKELVEIEDMKKKLATMSEDIERRVVEGVTDYFNRQQIGEDFTRQELHVMLQEASSNTINSVVKEVMTEISEKFDTIIEKFEGVVPAHLNPNQNGGPPRPPPRPVNLAGGTFTRLPLNWRFPCGTCLDLWMQWCMDDTAGNVPALRKCAAKDFSFLDTAELLENENRGRRGPKPKARGDQAEPARRPSSKTFSDIKYLCKFIQSKAERDPTINASDYSLNNVMTMFDLSRPVIERATNSRRGRQQAKWRTTVGHLQKYLKQHPEQDPKNINYAP